MGARSVRSASRRSTRCGRSFERDPGDVFVERLRAALCFEAAEAARFLGAWRAANLERFFCDLAEAIAAGEPVGALLRRIRRAVAEEETPSAEPTSPGSLDAVTGRDAARREGPRLGSRVPRAAAQGRRARRAPGACGRLDGGLETTWCGVPTLAFDVVLERTRQVAEAERVRTLYVGMTRARERLVVSGVWPEFLRGGEDSHAALLAQRDPARPDWAQLAGRVVDGRAEELDACWVIPALAAPVAAEPAAELDPAGAVADALPIAVAAPIADAEARSALPIGASVTALAGSEDEAEPGDRPGAQRSAALIGTVIHAALERLDLDAETAAQWSAQRERIAAQIRAAAAPGERERALADALACWTRSARGRSRRACAPCRGRSSRGSCRC
jgi:hypothetical protein